MPDTGRGALLDSPWLEDPRQLRKGLYIDDAGPATWSDWAFQAAGAVVALPSAASLALSGSAPAVARPVASLPTAASLSSGTSAPEVVLGAVAIPTAAALAASGSTPTVTAPAASLPAGASLAASGSAPEVAATQNVTILPTRPSPLEAVGSAPDVTGGGVASAGVPQGLFMRGMAPVAYNGPTVERTATAVRIRQASIDAARARFKRINEEDELVLGLMEAA